MKVKLKHRVSGSMAEIGTDHDRPNGAVKVALEVEPFLKRDLQQELEAIPGFYGHVVRLDAITNLDLSYVVRSLPSFELISVEPQINPSPLPENVQT